MEIYVCLFLGMILSANVALASGIAEIMRINNGEADIFDEMLLENSAMFAEDVTVELDEQNRDAQGFTYKLYDGIYRADLNNMDLTEYDLTQDHIEIRVPDKVIKDGVAYTVHTANFVTNINDELIKFKFYLGKYIQKVGCCVLNSKSTFFVHPENKYFTTEQGSLFDYKKETLLKFYDGIYSYDMVYTVPQTVKCIESYAFWGARIKEVILGDKVSTISYSAFRKARIQRVNLNQVKYVGDSAFEQCELLWEIILPQEGVSLRESCFAYCNYLEQLYLPANTKLGDSCFSHCERLETIVMGDGCTFATEKAAVFYECRNLKVLILPNTMTAFGWDMIGRCNVLKKLYLPSQLRQIVEGKTDLRYNYAITLCSVNPESPGKEYAERYETVTFESLEEHVHSWKRVTYVSMDKWGVVGNYCPECKCGEDIERITWRGEEDKEKLPPFLKVEPGVCPECLELDDENKDEFGIYYKLDRAQRIAEIIKVDSSPSHSGYWFPPATVKREGIIYTVEKIGQYVFRGQRGLVLPDTIKELADNFFSDGLDLLVIGAGVKKINAYNGIRNVGRIEVSENNEYFCCENNVLYNKDKTRIISVGRYGIGTEIVFTVPQSVIEIGAFVRFEGCLDKVQIYNKEDVYIDDSVFFGENVEIEYLEWGEPLDENNTDMDGRKYVLNENTKTAVFAPEDLSIYEGEKVTTPYKVEKDGIIYLVDGISFEQVKVLNADKVVLKIGKHIQNIDFGMHDTSKIYCEVDWENPYFCQLRGILLSGARDILYHFYDGEMEPGTVYQLPLQVEKIGAGAFRGTSIASVVGGERLISIGTEAFAGCRYLEELKLQKEGLEIGDHAFSGCVRLKNMYLPQNVTVGSAVFRNCEELQRVIMDQGAGWGALGNSDMPNRTQCYDYQSLEGHEHSLKEVTFFCYEDWGVKGKYCEECDCGTEYEVVVFKQEGDRNRMPELLKLPSEEPMDTPLESAVPSAEPTQSPSTEPTSEPTDTPELPTPWPTRNPSAAPTQSPSAASTQNPSEEPTQSPSVAPTQSPSEEPMQSPSAEPTQSSSAEPTQSPSAEPTQSSSVEPTQSPSAASTSEPTKRPELPTPWSTQSPSAEPMQSPSEELTCEPTDTPELATPWPTQNPSAEPTQSPSEEPTSELTERPELPTSWPTQNPSVALTQSSSEEPTFDKRGDETYLLLQYIEKLEVTGFRVSSTKEKTVKLSWNRNAYAKCYQIYRAPSKTGNYKLVKMVSKFHVSYVDEGVQAKKKYFYKIRALGVWENKLIEGRESKIRMFYTAGICTPKILVKKGQINNVRYIAIVFEQYEGKYVEIYISQNTRKFKKLKLVSNKIARYKGRFKLKYMVKNQKIRFKVRTYRTVGVKKIYSKFSKIVGVHV